MDVRILHDDRGRIEAIEFQEAKDFIAVSNHGLVTVWLETEAGMDWHRLREVVEQEAAAEDAP